MRRSEVIGAAKQERFVELWANGATYREISEQLAIGAPTLERLRVDLKLPKRNPGHFTHQRKDRALHTGLKCLCCRREFQTQDRKKNRICGSCKNTDLWICA